MSFLATETKFVIRASRSCLVRSDICQIRHVSHTCRLQSSRTSSRNTGPAPSVRRSRAQAVVRPGASKTSSNVERVGALAASLPPLSLLHEGYKAGALVMKPDAAIEIIENFHAAFLRKGSSWEARFCQENNATPEHLMLLGGLLNRCAGDSQRMLGKQLMLAASSLGDEAATLQLLKPVIGKGRLRDPDYVAPLRQLNRFAKDGSMRSMVLLGRIKQEQGNDTEALELFGRAASSVSEDGSGTSATVANALVYKGLLQRKSDPIAAEVTFRQAALEYDNFYAYYQLAGLQEEGSPDKEIYLTKAASSGVTEACHELGLLLINRAKTDKENARSLIMTGSEWLHMGAAARFGPSMLSLASYLMEVGQVKDALGWIDGVSVLPAFRQQAEEMRARCLERHRDM